MTDENFENGAVSGDSDVGRVGSGVDSGTNNPSNLGSGSELSPDSRLVPGVPVEDIPGLDEAKAIELGLLKTPEQYAAEEAEVRAKEIQEAEAFPHTVRLNADTAELVQRINNCLVMIQTLGVTFNKSYGKFMTLGMEVEAQHMLDSQGNIHFQKLTELLQEAKARAILLNVELGTL